jgi:hypothetical protein
MNTSGDSAKNTTGKFSIEAFTYSVVLYFFLAFFIGIFSTRIEAIENNTHFIKIVLLVICAWFYRYIKKTIYKKGCQTNRNRYKNIFVRMKLKPKKQTPAIITNHKIEPDLLIERLQHTPNALIERIVLAHLGLVFACRHRAASMTRHTGRTCNQNSHTTRRRAIYMHRMAPS